MSAFGITLGIVEDNDDHYNKIVKLLKETQPEGYLIRYRFERFTTLDETLRKVPAHKPDILILDLSLPDSVGVNTYSHVSILNVPIIVTTVLEDVALGIQCMREGAISYFVKEWIDNNPLLLHMSILFIDEITRQEGEIQDFIKERLQIFRALIPRCPFCINRIGIKRWKDESTGEWMLPDDYIVKYSDIHFTDGICRECLDQIDKDESNS